ncbi:hypothetical protein HNQ91_005461 [Filimonas zeae]|uniref:DUF1543 domain-containing protein n=1 Tax=Filimonas zeae TaxID=1737353 RepID=A0A917J4Z8_9BACT|nr:DUF1543 domain-containing protein [Filimonas zeae]MDR6342377.1 hypothetical protein [Filimonas zeae]GGH81088.1 hypothetical protein GCM10011379_52930 [Filimonas zeae]
MSEMKLYMFLLGCKPAGRHTEQHDIFFGVGASVKELVPAIKTFWPEGKEGIHIDAWREVTRVNGYRVTVVPLEAAQPDNAGKLFFLNLGGYKAGEFEEYHYKVLSIANDKNSAIKEAKQLSFFKHSASAHVDDKYGVDVDDMYEVADILPQSAKAQFHLQIEKAEYADTEDVLHLGYFKLNSF